MGISEDGNSPSGRERVVARFTQVGYRRSAAGALTHRLALYVSALLLSTTASEAFGDNLYEYNAANQLTRVVNTDTGRADVFTYDDAGNLTSITSVALTSATAAPTSLSFGNQLLGTTSASQTVTVSNCGTYPVTIGGVSVIGTNAPDFSITNGCGVLSPSESCNISVRFTPGAMGNRSATLQMDDGTSTPPSVALAGTGVAPLAAVSPTSLAYGNQLINTSSTRNVTLTNSGSSTLTITGISVSGANASDFVSNNNCPASLAPAGSCTVSVTFTPPVMGSRAATLQITSNANNGTQSVGLSGTGVAAVASVSPSSLSFSSQRVNSTSPPQTVTVTNTGTSGLTISSVTLAGANPTDFSTTNGCGSPVAPSQSCTISVAFTPLAMGARAATLQIVSNATNGLQSVALGGTGIAPLANVSPASLSFGNQRTNTISTGQAVTVTNAGTAALSVSSVTFGGTNPGDFAVNNGCAAAVAPTQSCTLTVTFTPAATGSRSATLQVASDANNGTQVVTLSGTGTAPTATVAPTAWNFGDQIAHSSSAAKAFTVTNTGTATLNVSSASLAGTNPGDFGVNNGCTAGVAPTQTCTINVTFAPTAMGNRSATLQIASDASNGTRSASLSGNGIAALAGVSPGALTFANQALNTSSDAQTITVTNSGTAPLAISSVTNQGGNTGDFLVTSNGCTSAVAVGASCAIGIAFKPTGIGARSTTLQIASNAFNGAQSVALSGSATVKITAFTANPTTVSTGESTTLTWTSMNASTCTGSGDTNLASSWNGTKATSGSLNFTPVNRPGTYTLTLTCTDSGGNSDAESVTYTLTWL